MTTIKTFVKIAKQLPARTSVMVRANHGVGKSQVVKQIARDLGFKPEDIYDKRCSQMTEGDIIGLPDKDLIDLEKVTRFIPVEWILAACKGPKFLFLDELNRATLEVMQSVFQLVLDRELNGHKLHPETRIYVAVNISAEYTVNEFDPALLDRFWVCDLEPTLQDWVAWARGDGNILDIVVDFVSTNEKWLDPPKKFESGKKTPSRRSWESTSIAVEKAGLDDNPHNDEFFHTCLGYLGFDAADAFTTFARKKDNRITGKEILEADDFEKVKKKIDKLGQAQWNICIDRVMNYISKTPLLEQEELTETQIVNLYKFIENLPDELKVSLWAKMMEKAGKRVKLARQVQKRCHKLVTGIYDD